MDVKEALEQRDVMVALWVLTVGILLATIHGTKRLMHRHDRLHAALEATERRLLQTPFNTYRLEGAIGFIRNVLKKDDSQ